MIKSIRNIEFKIGGFSSGESSFELVNDKTIYTEKEDGIFSEPNKVLEKELKEKEKQELIKATLEPYIDNFDQEGVRKALGELALNGVVSPQDERFKTLAQVDDNLTFMDDVNREKAITEATDQLSSLEEQKQNLLALRDKHQKLDLAQSESSLAGARAELIAAQNDLVTGRANFEKKIDENAAAFILQGALDFLNN